jgi:environmental stress-induced protein Ves
MAWANGAGVTYEVAVSPEGAGLTDFDWRISIAAIERDAPFSAFEGIDRTLMLIDGDRMVVTIDDVAHSLAPGQPIAFRGEDRASCALPSGPTRDLNIMTRRGVIDATLEVIGGVSDFDFVPRAGETVFLVVLSGEWSTVDEPAERLVPNEFARMVGPLHLTGRGGLARIGLRPAPA